MKTVSARQMLGLGTTTRDVPRPIPPPRPVATVTANAPNRIAQIEFKADGFVLDHTAYAIQGIILSCFCLPSNLFCLLSFCLSSNVLNDTTVPVCTHSALSGRLALAARSLIAHRSLSHNNAERSRPETMSPIMRESEHKR